MSSLLRWEVCGLSVLKAKGLVPGRPEKSSKSLLPAAQLYGPNVPARRSWTRSSTPTSAGHVLEALDGRSLLVPCRIPRSLPGSFPAVSRARHIPGWPNKVRIKTFINTGGLKCLRFLVAKGGRRSSECFLHLRRVVYGLQDMSNGQNS